MLESTRPSQDFAGSRVNKGVTILLVDDDPAILEGVVDLLQLYGYNLLTASDGKLALEVMQDYTPDLVISDIMMPEMDGYEFYEAVRSRPEWVPIPFIFLTARGQQVDIRRGQSLGADAYLVKPFEPEDLLIAIDARLRRARAIQAVTQADVDQMKQQLITIFSHELRTPLTYIYGYVNLLQDGRNELDSDTVDEMLEGVRLGAERLVKLVEDLMLMVRIDSGVVQIEIDQRSEPVELSGVVTTVLDKYQHLAAKNRVVIKTDIAPGLVISGVRAYVGEVLMRLVENAIKFANPGDGEVVITGAVQDETVAVAVADNGIGISPSNQKDIFERFVQLNRDLLEQQGIGLGLPIARSLMELHGGEITLESQVGKGSVFTLLFPMP
jgi:two-component system sensor histidine kinase/response regulator